MAETVPTPSGDNNVSNSDSIQLKDKLDYAWKWFEYHAGQRLVAFNFLLVLMGALSVGYYKAYDAGEYIYAAVVAVFGVIVAIAFFILEVRNEKLVNTGRDALKSIEALPKFTLLRDDPCRLLSEDRKRSYLGSHAFWLRTIEVVLLILFVLATIVSGLKVAKKWTHATNQQTGGLGEMPYIKQERRQAILAGARPQDAGELNFAITILVDNYLKDKGGIRYGHLNEVIGAMDCAKLELYRRVAAPYEDKKIKESGDVYRSNETPPSPQ